MNYTLLISPGVQLAGTAKPVKVWYCYYYYHHHHHHHHHLLYAGYYTDIPETNYVPREYGVATILLFLFMVLVSLVSVLNLLYFSINPLPVQFKAVLRGQKGCVFFSGHLNLPTRPEIGLPSREKNHNN